MHFMKLEKYISDLLYRYDLVIIPNFGGIIGRKKTARFDHDTYIFSPPHKELSFNIQLQDNDGLLANYVADIEEVSYEKALQLIEQQVKEWQNILQNNKRLKLDQIGIFNLVAEDKILFLPLTTRNYLAEAYGLTSFIHKPVIKNIKKPAEKAVAKTVIATPKTTVKAKNSFHKPTKKVIRKKTQKNREFWKYAAVFVVGLGLFGGGIGYLKNQSTQSQEKFQKATFVLPEDFPVITIANSISVDSKKTVTENESKKYFIISGAFRNKQNAEKKRNELIQSGYQADIIGKNKYNLWMVAYQGFSDEQKAREVLKNIKTKQASAWLFKK